MNWYLVQNSKVFYYYIFFRVVDPKGYTYISRALRVRKEFALSFQKITEGNENGASEGLFGCRLVDEEDGQGACPASGVKLWGAEGVEAEKEGKKEEI